MRLKSSELRQGIVEILSNSTKPLSTSELKAAYFELHGINAIPETSKIHVKDIFYHVTSGLVDKGVVKSMRVKGQRGYSFELVVGTSLDKSSVSSSNISNNKKHKIINDDLRTRRMEIDDLQLKKASSVEAINALLQFIDEYKCDSVVIPGIKDRLRKERDTLAITSGRIAALQCLVEQLEVKHSFK